MQKDRLYLLISVLRTSFTLLSIQVLARWTFCIKDTWIECWADLNDNNTLHNTLHSYTEKHRFLYDHADSNFRALWCAGACQAPSHIKIIVKNPRRRGWDTFFYWYYFHPCQFWVQGKKRNINIASWPMFHVFQMKQSQRDWNKFYRAQAV